MEHHKISELLNNLLVSNVCGKKWIEGNNLSSGQDSVNQNIRFKTLMLRSNLCAYIVVKGELHFGGCWE